jgi:hypothetical protein
MLHDASLRTRISNVINTQRMYGASAAITFFTTVLFIKARSQPQSNGEEEFPLKAIMKSILRSLEIEFLHSYHQLSEIQGRLGTSSFCRQISIGAHVRKGAD